LATLLVLGIVAACSPKDSDYSETVPPSPPEELKPGRAVTRKIWKDTSFVFDGKAGEVIALRVTSKASGLDPHVALLDPEREREAFDDDSGGHGNSLIKDHTLKRNGRYTAVVGVAENNEGEVEILLQKTKPKTTPRTP